MSTRPQHRIRSTSAVLAATVVLIGTTGSVAAADPPALDQDSCSTTLAKVTLWPGTMSDGDSEIRLVSDAFDSYLSRQSSCTADRSQL